MKKLLLSLLAAGLFTAPSIAHAAASPYVSISGGVGFMTNSDVSGVPNIVTYKTGYLVNGAIGLKNDFYRLEAEVGYHRNTVETWNGGSPWVDEYVSIWSFMANGYLDYEMKDSGISPYIMGGIGYASVKNGWASGSDSDGAFAWQIGAGLGIKAADKVNIDIGYRYFATADVELYGDMVSIGSHNILAGVRIGI
ncbi:MAG: porin family protein [Chlorobiaceae bacterium]|nr:porin family protein [Chlorobiaceae bacterium]